MSGTFRRFEILLPLRFNDGQPVYRDDLTRVFLDVPDTPESFEFFREFKETVKQRFQQIDIWMTTYPIQVI